MSELEEIKIRLRELAAVYKPSVTAAAAIADVTLINIIGPTGVGKSSINHKVVETDADFSVPVGFTSREPRSDEKLKRYRHIPNTLDAYKRLLKKAEAGQLIQYTFHTTSGMIYGTEPQDYQTKYSVLDMMYQYVEKTSSLGFKTVKNIALVTTVDDYEKQLKKQRDLIDNDVEMEKRRQEGILCLEWCQAHAKHIIWVHNRYGLLDQTARQIIRLAKDGMKSDPNDQNLATGLLKRLKAGG